MKRRKYRLGSRSRPKTLADVVSDIEQMIQDEAESFREIDGVVRNPNACRLIRSLRTARDYVKDFAPSETAILNDQGDDE